ncbi:UNVERIFIED_ORG: hypothetical protein B2H98_06870 [Clostridium botulinum]|nr:hypothetical protein [Clostridium botulinum]HBJ2623607.1 hypothetical protein [Clostridium botulinum]
MSFEVIKFIDRKKAGMVLLCQVIAKSLEGKAKNSANWKDRTANARQGISSESTGGNGDYKISLNHGVSYGEILEEGSKPHIITPKNGKALYWKGAAHPVKKINHPGTEGFHTFENTLEESKGEVISTITGYWSD